MTYRDKCKCGGIVVWNANMDEVVCKSCNRRYRIDADSVLVYWLVEKFAEKPWTTEAKY